MQKKNIALVMGGYSGEYAVSIASGNQVYEQLDHTKYNVYKIVIDRQGWYGLIPAEGGETRVPVDMNDFSLPHPGASGQGAEARVRFDLAFIIVHGNPGENGVLQGYLDMLGIRHTTCGFYTSALTFHKGFCNPVVGASGLARVARSVLLHQEPAADGLERLIGDMRYPLFVKPAAGGSSVATSKVKQPADLLPAIREAFTEDGQVLVEECITGRELDCGVFRKGDGETLVFPLTEIIPTDGHEFFDYAAKYEGFSNEVTPAEVSPELASHVQEVSRRLYDLLGCRGIVRFDYIYGHPAAHPNSQAAKPESHQDELYFLEVNTVPGQSAESIVPKQARAMGIEPAELYEMAIQAALPN